MVTTAELTVSERIHQLAESVLAGQSISREDALWLTTVHEPHLMDLFAAANRIRHKFVGDNAHICSIVNAKSGSCSEDCGFCAQSAHFKTASPVYKMMPSEQIAKSAEVSAEAGSTKFGIVISGRELKQGQELDQICEAISKIRDEGKIIPDASLGIVKDPEVFRKLKDAGLRQYHHNLETARSHHRNIVTTHSYDEEFETVKLARDMGLKTCSGGIFGMGEDWAQRVEMAFDLKELDPETVPLNFLVPVEGTPLGHLKDLGAMDVLKITAIYRFILPRQHLALCGGREYHLGDLQGMMLLTGGNGFMLGNYLTTNGRSAADDMNYVQKLGWKVVQPEDEAACK